MTDIGLLVAAAGCVILAGLLSCADAALIAFSPARAAELAVARRGGAKALVRLLEDPTRVSVFFLAPIMAADGDQNLDPVCRILA